MSLFHPPGPQFRHCRTEVVFTQALGLLGLSFSPVLEPGIPQNKLKAWGCFIEVEGQGHRE